MNENNNETCSVPGARVKLSVESQSQGKFVVVGDPDQSLENAITKVKQDRFDVHDHIYFAEVKNHCDEVAVLPSISCFLLKNDSCVETFKKSKRAQDCKPAETCNPTENRGPDHEKIFFITTCDRKYKDAMTVIPYQEFRGKDLCVRALQDDTIEMALKRDGRFKKVPQFILRPKKDQQLKVDITHNAWDFANNILSVDVKRRPYQRKAKAREDKLPSHQDGKNPVHIKKEPLENTDDNYATVKKDAIFATVSPSADRRYQPLYEKAKSRAFSLLLGPAESNTAIRGESPNKRIFGLVEQAFSKKIDESRLCKFIKKLSVASDYVGHIFCGNLMGTCFLVNRKGYVMTNYHVYKRIVEEIKSSKREPMVSFDYMDVWQSGDCHTVEVLVKEDEVLAKNVELDYVVLRLEDDNQNELLLNDPPEVSVSVPQEGLVAIIGHPDGGPKKIDLNCRLIPQHLWRTTAQERVREQGRLVVQPSDEYVIACKEISMKDKYLKKLPYDTSFFEGASGYPVFDDKGRIVAMHTLGLKLEEEILGKPVRGSVSLVEFGVSIKHICEDLGPKRAKELLPTVVDEPMES